MAEIPVLIWHVGAGKTGTTSIQRTLSVNQSALFSQGVKYLGYMLEGAQVQKYPWQHPAEIEVFHGLSEHETEEALDVIFQEEMRHARSMGVHTLIWSNESFYGRSEKALRALLKFDGKYFRLKIIAYVRSYEKWAKSAYIQWGIKHKTYNGKIRSFEEWFSGREYSFYESFLPVIEQCPDKFTLRNMEHLDDVVVDFLRTCSIEPEGIQIFRVYESPGNLEIYLRSIFNNQFEELVRPEKFDLLVGKNIRFDASPARHLRSLLPDRDVAENISSSFSADREKLNRFLLSKREPPVNKDTVYVDTVEIDTDTLVGTLTDIVMHQTVFLQEMNDKVVDLERRMLSCKDSAGKQLIARISDVLKRKLKSFVKSFGK
jgi:hypothetical protein